MNFSLPFIRRPIGTALLAIGLCLVGLTAYWQLPVASLPSVEFPTVRVSASRPGADPATMAATVAAPLERRLGEIAGVTEMSSRSSLGTTNIIIQFDLDRDLDGAGRDVQAAINAAMGDLPADLPSPPNFRKANPNASPILILALRSETTTGAQMYDIADSVIVQRIAQVPGVAEVSVSGAEQPAVRIRVNPIAAASMGISLEEVRQAIAAANSRTPLGSFQGEDLARTIGSNEQLREPPDYENLVVKTSNGTVVRLGAIATIEQGVRNSRSAAWFNLQPSVLLTITRQPDANVIDTADGVMAVLPEIKRWIPADMNIEVLSDRTQTIRASVFDMQMTLAAAIGLVMLVVFLFLRRGAATLAAGVTVPLALTGTLALMWAMGFSVNNLTLMALAIAVGFVVDDAIVVIENVFRNLEKGRSPLRATLEGTRQIGFTVISTSVSLVAAFIPLLFMGGVVGRLFHEFAMTLACTVLISMMVALSVTPMICAHFVREAPSRTATWLDRTVEGLLQRMLALYSSSLTVVMRERFLTMVVLFATIGLTVFLYIQVPKGYFPQDDTGLIFGGTRASPEISFERMKELQQRATEIVLADPAVAAVGSSVGGSGFSGSVNNGRLFINLKPLEEREGISSQDVINRLRPKLTDVGGMRVFMMPAQDIRAGGRQSNSQYQFTAWSSDLNELRKQMPRIADRLRTVPEIVDVDTDREQGGLQAEVVVDRQAAARLGVRIADVGAALNNSFSQRQVSTIYTGRNQYRAILEVDPQFQRDPSDLDRVHVPSADGKQIPLSAVARVERGLAALTVNHQGQFPSMTVSFNLAPGVSLEQGTAAVDRAVAGLHLPDSIRTEFGGDARDAQQTTSTQPLLILAALITVYIILGVLYESLIHPLTIISTLPSAGLGALLALILTGTPMTVIAFIGIILLIGIVKKNGIMMVDFAIQAERRGVSPEKAIHQACLERFRPIIMTTMATMLGAVPLLIAIGPGAELRRPLGITVIGGLMVSQLLTLYTTPVIYLLLDRLRGLRGKTAPKEPDVPNRPAEAAP